MTWLDLLALTPILFLVMGAAAFLNQPFAILEQRGVDEFGPHIEYIQHLV